MCLIFDSVGNSPICNNLRSTLNVSCQFAKTNLPQWPLDAALWTWPNDFHFSGEQNVCVNFPCPSHSWPPTGEGDTCCSLPTKHSSWGFSELTTQFCSLNSISSCDLPAGSTPLKHMPKSTGGKEEKKKEGFIW